MKRLICAAVWWSLLGLPAAAQQYRAFWADAFHDGFKTPAQVDQMVEDALAAKCNAIFAEVRRRGDSYYLDSLEPLTEDPDFAPDFDALAYLIDKAHARGIEVHAWFPITPLWLSDRPPLSPDHLWNRHGPMAQGDDMWLTVDSKGNLGAALDPGHPAASQFLVDMLLHVAAAYDVDGIHLDYIRYPETADFGWNPTAVARYQRLYGHTGIPTSRDADFAEFRRQQVTALVRQTYLRLLALKPQVKLSAATITWGDGPANDAAYRTKDAYSRVFQDWRGWLEEGILDFSVPMNYFREAQLPAYLDHWLEYEKDRQYGRMTVPGLAVYLNAIPDSLGQVSRVLNPSRAGNTGGGVVYYSYASTNTLDASGVPQTLNAQFYQASGAMFPDAGPAPDLPWKSQPSKGHLSGWLRAASEKDGVKVVVESLTDASVVRQTTTDGTGFFGVVDLPPDQYQVRMLKGDREIFRSDALEVTAGVVRQLEVSLADSEIPPN